MTALQFGKDDSYQPRPGCAVLYLAGGCFWGLEKLMQSLPGVTDAVSGYANGISQGAPSYQQVCTGDTGYRETVRVEYDPAKISIDAILFAYFYVIDPTLQNRQGNDVGSQYQAGIYYADEQSQGAIERIAAIQRERYQPFAVEIAPLVCFYPAEAYHQNYLDKNPGGYCHIPKGEQELLSSSLVDPGQYPRPTGAQLRQRLTPEQYRVTQEADTEPPFQNAYWQNRQKGIYVDIATGEPLFSSADQYQSACGWPAFCQPIDGAVLHYVEDSSYGMQRTEVKSRAGNSHLGHVFMGDGESPNGTRFCINSAALRFIPYERMASEGYGYLLDIFVQK